MQLMLPAITVYENLERLKIINHKIGFIQSHKIMFYVTISGDFFSLTPIGRTPHTDNQQFNKCTIFPSFVSALHYKMCLLLKD